VVFSLALVTSIVPTLITDTNAQTEDEVLSHKRDCDKGELSACNWLGVRYDNAQQYKKAFQFLTKACDGGFALACSNVAELYFDGRETRENHERAYELFKIGCDNKIFSGCAGKCVVIMTDSVDIAQKYVDLCQKAINLACENGNPWMCSHRGQLSTQKSSSDKRTCPDAAARVLGHVYFLSNPISEENLQSYVSENRSYFAKDGAVVRCAEALGKRLVFSGVNAYDPKAYERAMGAGPAEFAPDVATSINSGAVNLVVMGLELQWLARVLPSAARGDWELYNTTGTQTRLQIRQVLPMYQTLLSQDPQMAQMVREIMKDFEPMAEEQILMLARMLD